MLEAKTLPKSIPKSVKIHSQSHPETKPKKTTKIYNPPLQTLKIELSCRCGASFHYFTVFKNMPNSSPKTSEKYPEILNKSDKKWPQKLSEKWPNSYHVFDRNIHPKWCQKAPLSPTSASEPPYDPKATPEHQNVRKSDFEAPIIEEKVLPKDHFQ